MAPLPLTAAQKLLVTAHLRLAERAARRSVPVHRDDCYQDACEGLISAARNWDPKLGVPFAGWRRSGRRPRPVSLEETDQLDTVGDDRPPIEEQIVDLAAARSLLDLARTAEMRRILEAIALGVSQRTIAARLGVTESAVSHRLRQLRSRVVRRYD